MGIAMQVDDKIKHLKNALSNINSLNHYGFNYTGVHHSLPYGKVGSSYVFLLKKNLFL